MKLSLRENDSYTTGESNAKVLGLKHHLLGFQIHCLTKTCTLWLKFVYNYIAINAIKLAHNHRLPENISFTLLFTIFQY